MYYHAYCYFSVKFYLQPEISLKVFVWSSFLPPVYFQTSITSSWLASENPYTRSVPPEWCSLNHLSPLQFTDLPYLFLHFNHVFSEQSPSIRTPRTMAVPVHELPSGPVGPVMLFVSLEKERFASLPFKWVQVLVELGIPAVYLFNNSKNLLCFLKPD